MLSLVVLFRWWCGGRQIGCSATAIHRMLSLHLGLGLNLIESTTLCIDGCRMGSSIAEARTMDHITLSTYTCKLTVDPEVRSSMRLKAAAQDAQQARE